MTVPIFAAGSFSWSLQDEVMVLGLADGGSSYLLLQRLKDDPDGLYVEIDDQRRGAYGAVKGICLSAARIEFQLTAAGAQRLEAQAGLCIDISQVPGKEELEQRLREVCAPDIAVQRLASS